VLIEARGLILALRELVASDTVVLSYNQFKGGNDVQACSCNIAVIFARICPRYQARHAKDQYEKYGHSEVGRRADTGNNADNGRASP
jgi:hypothetical protein